MGNRLVPFAGERTGRESIRIEAFLIAKLGGDLGMVLKTGLTKRWWLVVYCLPEQYSIDHHDDSDHHQRQAKRQDCH